MYTNSYSFFYFLGGCPSASWKRFGNFCYLMNSNVLTLPRASNHCESIGGQLVRITGADLNKFLVQKYTKRLSTIVWIGLTKCGNTWCYPDGKESIYANWRKGEPNNARGDESCVEMYTNGEWNDSPCEKEHPFICEISKSLILKYTNYYSMKLGLKHTLISYQKPL